MLCHSSTSPGYIRCRQCVDAGWTSPPEILPITMSIDGGPIHHMLRMYKDSADAKTRDRLTVRLAALIAVFIRRHDACVGDWDVATCVPSRARVAMRPIVDKLKRFEHRTETLLRSRPDVDAGRSVDPLQFDIVGKVDGRRVLLLDDTFASGGKVFSAAAALTANGATIVGPLVIGRHVHPSWPPSETMLEWLGDREWDESRCCRCDGELRDDAALF
jgi:hypothetical protein